MKKISVIFISAVTMVPSICLAAEGDVASGIPWVSIISGVLGIATVVAGIGWGKAKKVAKETKELLEVIEKALEDDSVSNEELTNIIKEGKDVGIAVADLVKQVGGLFGKK